MSVAAAVVVTAIRVQDVKNNIWWSWDNGSWDNTSGTGKNAPSGQTPRCAPGASLYIAFFAVNNSPAAGDTNCHLQLWQDQSQYPTLDQTVQPGQGFGYEWTGLMANTDSVATCVSWSDLSPTQKLVFNITAIKSSMNTALIVVAGIALSAAAIGAVWYYTNRHRHRHDHEHEYHSGSQEDLMKNV